MREPDFLGAINVETGKSYLFAPFLPEEYAVWMGELRTLDDFKQHYQVDEAHWVDDVRRNLIFCSLSIIKLFALITNLSSPLSPTDQEGPEGAQDGRSTDAVRPELGLRHLLEAGHLRRYQRVRC